MTATKWLKQWQPFIEDGKPFRASVKMWKGKQGRLGYKYINFSRIEQFKTWLTQNESRIYDVVNVAQ
jgi:hypothetical protein